MCVCVSVSHSDWCWQMRCFLTCQMETAECMQHVKNLTHSRSLSFSPTLSLSDPSQEYTDSTGIDLHEFLVNTLKNNPRYVRCFRTVKPVTLLLSVLIINFLRCTIELAWAMPPGANKSSVAPLPGRRKEKRQQNGSLFANSTVSETKAAFSRA